MTTFFLLWHRFRPEPDSVRDDEFFIGVYATEERARMAIELLRMQPGFKDYPDGFVVERRSLDETSWQEGFTPVSSTSR